MDITERFLNYTKFDTQSAEESDSVPSTSKQLIFAEYLKKELEREGLDDVELDEKGYLYATLKANVKGDIPTIGFISHYDTSPDCSGADIKPQIVHHYDGSDILLSEGIISSPKKFPELLQHIGEDLIVTDGHTLLGADDKAGIAEIIQAMVYLQEHPEIKHGKIRIAFNPDEEIGMGAHHFDVEKFGCEWAYTMDGGDVGELEFENFNAASAKITVNGINIHPGSAKNKMKNAVLIANELVSMLPAAEAPAHTEKYEGFYHVNGISGNETQVGISMIIRDHDRDKFEQRKQFVTRLTDYLNGVYGAGTVELKLRDSYYNMKEMVLPHPEVLGRIEKAYRACGITPEAVAIRGGTDGARLSFMGLPCPNLSTGGENFHGVHEFASINDMNRMVDVLQKIVEVEA